MLYDDLLSDLLLLLDLPRGAIRTLHLPSLSNQQSAPLSLDAAIEEQTSIRALARNRAAPPSSIAIGARDVEETSLRSWLPRTRTPRFPRLEK